MTALALFGLSFGTCLAAAAAAYRWIIRPLKQRDREELPQRTPADVLADADAYRARRIAEQAADDLDTCRHIWPNPPSWRTAQAQHRHDTARQRKEEDR